MGPLIALAVAAIVVLFITGLVRLAEPGLAFFPLTGEDETPSEHGIPYTPHAVTTDDGQRLRLWHLPRSDAHAQVIYFHGNGGNLSLWCPL